LTQTDLPPTEPAQVEKFMLAIAGEKRYGEFKECQELDRAYEISDVCRFRVNFYSELDGPGIAFRVIPCRVLSLADLRFPKVFKDICNNRQGLVLVTGPTGGGKSTTLAAMIDYINQTRQEHIITIEDPIEFVHKDRKCIVNQRSIGQDSLSFGNALRASLREDPDIILVGEMRDMETIEIALHAADTGHLVFSTLHTLDAKETVNRIIATFPTEEQNRIRLTLASVLEGIISQRLIPTVDDKRTAALEVLVKTSRIEQLILENRDVEIRDAIEEGKEIYGSQSFDQGILDLYNAGKISREKAFEFATSPSDLKLKMEGLNMSTEVKAEDSEESTEEKSFKEEDIFELKRD
jgi:twitching motility protein PilT